MTGGAPYYAKFPVKHRARRRNKCYNTCMKQILLGVCGSVAAYKAAVLVRLLRPDYEIQTMMTAAAQQFIGAATLRALSGKPVATDEWRAPLTAAGMDHIALVRASRMLLVAPASADFLAKAAAGMADGALLSAFLAADCPRWVAPAMNARMWKSPATQRNLRLLAEDGVLILPPAEGEQACGETGPGRMMEPGDIVEKIRAAAPLSGRRVVVSVGATAEKIDQMRVISNTSSGKMGFCIAEAARFAGAEVTVIAGRTTVAPPLLPLRRAVGNAEMYAAVMEECRGADIFIAAAAVADFAPAQPAAGKIRRESGEITLKLTATKDILAAVSARYPHLFSVGFSAGAGAKTAQIKTARQKMRRKKTAMFAANSVLDADGDDSELTLIYAAGEKHFPRQSKTAAAEMLIACVAAEFVSRETLQEAR